MDSQPMALIDDAAKDLLDPDSSSNIGVCVAITRQRVTGYPIDRG